MEKVIKLTQMDKKLLLKLLEADKGGRRTKLLKPLQALLRIQTVIKPHRVLEYIMLLGKVIPVDIDIL